MYSQFRIIFKEFSKPRQTRLRTEQLQALVTKTHLSRDPFYATKLVRFYAINDDIDTARKVFDDISQRSIFLWNAMIRAYAQEKLFGSAFTLFTKMLGSITKPDNFTYACIIRSCSENFDLDGLRFVHGSVVVSGAGSDYICGSALIMAYSKLRLVDEASKVFYRTPEPDLVMWNTMIFGYGSAGFWDKGIHLLNQMRFLGRNPDGYTMVGLITALSGHNLSNLGDSLHGVCLKFNLDSFPHVSSALLSMYSGCNSMSSAYRLFCNIPEPDLVTWSSLITGYSQSGSDDEALFFFRKLNMSAEKADPVLIASVLASCANLADIRPGREIHCFVLRQGLESNIMVSSALVDLYSKCGLLGLSHLVFHRMPVKNTVSYNSIILGLGLHGLASDALEKFNEMLVMGLKPDESTFSVLLCTCCHAGLVKEGREIFRKMKQDSGFQPQAEHCVYMVKLLGMAGELEEAFAFVKSLRKPQDSGVWGALLSCCEHHGNAPLAEIVAKTLFEIEPEKGVYRVMLSNVYACGGKWDEAEKCRDGISMNRAGKLPGLSWI